MGSTLEALGGLVHYFLLHYKWECAVCNNICSRSHSGLHLRTASWVWEAQSAWIGCYDRSTARSGQNTSHQSSRATCDECYCSYPGSVYNLTPNRLGIVPSNQHMMLLFITKADSLTFRGHTVSTISFPPSVQSLPASTYYPATSKVCLARHKYFSMRRHPRIWTGGHGFTKQPL